MKSIDELFAHNLRLAESDFGPAPPEAGLWLRRMHDLGYVDGVYQCTEISKPTLKQPETKQLEENLEAVVANCLADTKANSLRSKS